MADSNNNTKNNGLFGMVTSLFGKKEGENITEQDEITNKSDAKSKPNSNGAIQSMSNSFEYNWKQYNQSGSGKKVPGNAIKQIRGAAYPPPITPATGSNLGTQSISSDSIKSGSSLSKSVGNGLTESQEERTPTKSNSLSGSFDELKISGPDSDPTPNSSINSSTSSLPITPQQVTPLSRSLNNVNNLNSNSPISTPRLRKFHQMLSQPIIELEALKKVCWNGIPHQHRPMAWRLLLDYLPTNSERRDSALAKKRQEYADLIVNMYNVSEDLRSDYERAVHKQIRTDVPRTNPNVPIFQNAHIQKMLDRVLYIWAIRHPASGYVQGINDLVTPFITVFLSQFVDGDVETADINAIDPQILTNIEADSYWCLSKFIDCIQDHYTIDQPGIQRVLMKLQDLIQRIDRPLYDHMSEIGVHFFQFAFRWVNCLLMRELPLRLTIRLWDTYLCEGQFAPLHTYLCAALLIHFSSEIKQFDFAETITFLQHPPTAEWDATKMEVLLSQAFLWQTLYSNAPSHLKPENTINNSSNSSPVAVRRN
jgi:hypothetical protein